MKISPGSIIIVAVGASAYHPSSRRAFFGKAAVTMAGVASGAPLLAVEAIDACPKGSNNCIVTEWTPPEGTSKGDAAQVVLDVLNSYPQDGFDKVDKGGWTIVSNELGGASGAAAIEYKSGIGNFAKFLNGGKPFVDDLKLEMAANGVVKVRSSSRIGDSDLGVNQKRLSFLATGLRAKGWVVPEPKY